MKPEIVILGGGFLGVNAALDLAGEDVTVKLVDDNLNHEYIPGSIDLIRSRFTEEELSIDLENFLPETIETREEEVVDIKPDENVVETSQSLISYDKLVVGLGGKPEDYGLDITEVEHVWGLEPAQKLTDRADESDSALIIGGGYVGIEAAGELAEKGLDTTILDASTRPLSYLSEESSERILEVFNDKGISFKGDRRVIEVDNGSVVVNGRDEPLETDLVVWAGGVQASDIVQKSFNVGSKGLEVNNGLSVVEDDDVFAGGDCTNLNGQKTAHRAMNQGSIIADNILNSGKSLDQIEEDQKVLLASIGDTAAFVYKDKVLGVSKVFRYLKDFVKVYYFWRLKLKKRFSEDFLP